MSLTAQQQPQSCFDLISFNYCHFFLTAAQDWWLAAKLVTLVAYLAFHLHKRKSLAESSWKDNFAFLMSRVFRESFSNKRSYLVHRSTSSLKSKECSSFNPSYLTIFQLNSFHFASCIVSQMKAVVLQLKILLVLGRRWKWKTNINLLFHCCRWQLETKKLSQSRVFMKTFYSVLTIVID